MARTLAAQSSLRDDTAQDEGWLRVIPTRGVRDQKVVSVRVINRQVNINLSRPIVDELGWKPEDKFALMVGSGKNAGKWRVVHHSDGYKASRRDTGSAHITVAAWKDLPAMANTRRVDYAIEGKDLVIIVGDLQ